MPVYSQNRNYKYNYKYNFFFIHNYKCGGTTIHKQLPKDYNNRFYGIKKLSYIEKIIKRAPQYFKLQSISPGITSWGQVKYGYAENVNQMLERLEFDLAYLDTISLYTDFKILIYTFFIMMKGDGR